MLQSTKRAERLKIIRVIFFLELELIISVAIAHITHVWIAISIVASVIIISVEGSFRKPLRVYRIDGRKVWTIDKIFKLQRWIIGQLSFTDER